MNFEHEKEICTLKLNHIHNSMKIVLARELGNNINLKYIFFNEDHKCVEHVNT